jgi:heavy metal efflux system protein
MISRLLSFSVRAHWFIVFLSAVVAAYGAYELTRLRLDALPDITNKQVMINYAAPALGPEDVEKRITFPIEPQFRVSPASKARDPSRATATAR